MKMKFFFLFVFAGVLFASCQKEDVTDPQNPNLPKNMNELKANDDFSWKTSKDVTLTITGSHKMTISVKTKKGETVFMGLSVPGTELKTKVSIPTTEKELVVNYGPFSNTYTISSDNKINCVFDLNKF